MNPSKLHTGDILHCTRNTFISRLIKMVIGGEYSHTALFIEIWGQPFIVEAQKNGVNLKHFDAWTKKYNYSFSVSRFTGYPKISDEIISLRALSVAGVTPYDFESFLFRKPKEILTKKWNSRKNESKKMFCSEYVAWVYQFDNDEKMTPQQLYAYCLKDRDWMLMLK